MAKVEITERLQEIERNYERFYGTSEEPEKLELMDTESLLSELDDIVQVLSLCNQSEWMYRGKAHRAFNTIKIEINKRLRQTNQDEITELKNQINDMQQKIEYLDDQMDTIADVVFYDERHDYEQDED